MTTYAGIADLSGLTSVYSINAAGVVFGTYSEPSPDGTGATVSAPAFWQNGAPTPLLPYAQVSPGSWFGGGLNNGGVVAGYSEQVVTPGFLGAVPAFLQNGTQSLLALPGTDTGGYASGINDSGQIVGQTWGSDTTQSHAVLWQNGTFQILPALPGESTAAAVAINNSGLIAGESNAQATDEQAVIWQNGVVSALPTVSGEVSSSVSSVNAAGAVTGTVTLAGADHAAVWQNGGITLLAAPVGYTNCSAFGLNDDGQIVGIAAAASGNVHAVLWQNGTVTDLNSLLPANSGWVLEYAVAINDAGQIIGEGTYDGVYASFLLTLGGGSGTIEPSAALAAIQSFQAGQIGAPLALSDNAADVAANLDGLQALAAAGKLGSITLTDQGIPALSMNQEQAAGDRGVLTAIAGDFTISIVAQGEDLLFSSEIDGVAGRGSVLDVVDRNAADYTITPSGDGVGFTLADSADHGSVPLSDMTALKFEDYTEIIASQKPAVTGGVSSFQIAAIYSAVLDRVPDVAGLAYYENQAATNPSVSLITYAENFLQSPEYTSNSAHAYAQTSAGDAQFIQDTYANLLHRAPSASDVAWYQANVIAPILANSTPGTAAYRSAELQAHAQLLADFSTSAEFQNDVQVTAQQPANAQHWLVLI